jgi:hypothetical protein
VIFRRLLREILPRLSVALNYAAADDWQRIEYR